MLHSTLFYTTTLKISKLKFRQIMLKYPNLRNIVIEIIKLQLLCVEDFCFMVI